MHVNLTHLNEFLLTYFNKKNSGRLLITFLFVSAIGRLCEKCKYNVESFCPYFFFSDLYFIFLIFLLLDVLSTWALGHEKN